MSKINFNEMFAKNQHNPRSIKIISTKYVFK